MSHFLKQGSNHKLIRTAYGNEFKGKTICKFILPHRQSVTLNPMEPFLTNYNPQEELQFIKQAQDGSKAALEKLVKLHQRFIYNVALKLVHNSEDAADLTQEVLKKL